MCDDEEKKTNNCIENEEQEASTQEVKPKKNVFKKILKVIGCFFIWLISTLLVLLAGLYVLLMYVNKGPSEYVRNLFVSSAMESSVGGVMAKLFLSDAQIKDIMAMNSIEESDEITDTSLIKIATMSNNDAAPITRDELISEEDPDGDGIIIHEVHGPTYVGKMMIVLDPSRVKLGTCNEFVLDGGGLTLTDIAHKYDAVAAVNGGKYEDELGVGLGGMPEGIVIAGGRVLMGDPDEVYGVYGLTYNNVLVVGNMTVQQAVNMGVRDAVTFGPALITNGIPAKYQGVGSGLNPRTAIGQRADGAILLLVIEGRKASSVGASMADLINVMLEYEAVNAANLDGGMSSSMYYNGELIVTNSNIRSARRIPTAFYVERRDK